MLFTLKGPEFLHLCKFTNCMSKASLSRVICDNSDGITQAQPNAFIATQPRVPCSSLPSVNLAAWKEHDRNEYHCPVKKSALYHDVAGEFQVA